MQGGADRKDTTWGFLADNLLITQRQLCLITQRQLCRYAEGHTKGFKIQKFWVRIILHGVFHDNTWPLLHRSHHSFLLSLRLTRLRILCPFSGLLFPYVEGPSRLKQSRQLMHQLEAELGFHHMVWLV